MKKLFPLILVALLTTIGGAAAAQAAVPASAARQAVTVDDMVPLSSSPTEGARTVGHVAAAGTRVAVLQADDGWYRVRVGGGIAWVAARHLTLLPPADLPAPQTVPEPGPSPSATPRHPAAPKSVDAPPAPLSSLLLAAAPADEPADGPPPGADPGAAGADALSGDDPYEEIQINKIVFEGNTVVPSEDLERATAEYIEQPLTLEDMAALADLVTLAYQERGYILARAYLPEQELTGGVLKIAVAEGRIGKITVAGNKRYHPRVFKRYFNAQTRHEVVRESLLEKGLLLSNTTPKVKTDIVLKEGEKAGQVDVVLNTREEDVPTFGMTMSLDYNNYGVEQISQDRFGVDMRLFDHNWGATLDLRGILGNVYEETTFGSATLQIPINGLGTKLGFTYLESDYAIGQEQIQLGLGGDTMNRSVFITHPVFIQRDSSLNVTLGLEHKYAEVEQDKQVIAINELKEGFLNVDYESLDRYLGKNSASLRAYLGDVNFHEGQRPSRGDIDTQFNRFTLNLVRIQKLYGYTNLMLRGWGQVTNQRLLPIEMISIGGYGSVRGHDPVYAIQGDSGYNLSAELLFAPPYISEKELFGQRLAQLFQLALFYDTGGVNLIEPALDKRQYLSGYGFGLRVFYKDRFSLKYDLGFPSSKYDGAGDMVHYLSIQMKAF